MRRYIVPCFVIMLVALGSAGIAYAGAGSTQFSSTCIFHVGITPFDQALTSTDSIIAVNRLVQGALVSAQASGVTAEVARTQGIKAGTLSHETTLTPIGGVGQIALIVVDPKPQRAIAFANALCDQYIATIQQQRSGDVNNQIAVAKSRLGPLQAEVKRLQTIPPKKRTLSDKALLAAQFQAIDGNTTVIAKLLSIVPERIGVLKAASSSSRYDPRRFSKYLLIALTAGVLVCFLYVLAAEMVAEQRRR